MKKKPKPRKKPKTKQESWIQSLVVKNYTFHEAVITLDDHQFTVSGGTDSKFIVAVQGDFKLKVQTVDPDPEIKLRGKGRSEIYIYLEETT